MMLLFVILAAFSIFAWLWLARRARFLRVVEPLRPDVSDERGRVRGVAFPAIDGTRLDAWLFTPHGAATAAHSSGAPLVLLAPGLGGTKDGFLESFAWQLVERGVAALVFDYRCFGASEGAPRHWVDPERHRQDYAAALTYVRGALSANGEIDGTRIGLWGSSFSGGTAIITAAEQADVRALVVQCPFLRTPPELEPHGLSLARFVFWAVLDSLRILPPVYVPLFGRPGEWAFAVSRENPSVENFDGGQGAPFWRALPRPPLGGWENRMLARMLTAIDTFTPITRVHEVKCPTLFIAAQKDDMVPLAYVEEAHALATSPDKELRLFDCGHFDLYFGPPHEENARLQAEFFARHLSAT